MFSKKLLIIIIFTGICCVVSPLSSFAQGDPGCDPLDPLCPIDGGISLLIAAGIGIGARKAYKERKKEEGELKN